MKVYDYRETYYTYTGAVSGTLRTLLLAGVAVVWLFKKEVPAGIELPQPALWALLLFAAAALFDVLQYLVTGEIYHWIFRQAEREGKLSEDDLGLHPVWCNYPGLVLYWLKFAATLAGYMCLAHFLSTRIIPT